MCKLPFVKLNITHVKHVFSELVFCNLASIFTVDKMIQILKETFEKTFVLRNILYSNCIFFNFIWLQAPRLSERQTQKDISMHNYPYHKMTQEKQSQNVNFEMLVCNFNVDKSLASFLFFLQGVLRYMSLHQHHALMP